MTGKEKIETVVGIINKAHKELIKGSVVQLASYVFERAGINLEEQRQALDILSQKNEIIDYSASKQYQNIDMIPDDEKAALAEVAAMTVYSYNDLLKDATDTIIYTIEILDGFDRYTSNDSGNDSDRNDKTTNSNQVKLMLAGKILKMIHNGQTYTIHKFRSKDDQNYIVFKALLDNPIRYLSKQDMKVPKMASKVKDIPKTMGFTGELKNIFFSIDSNEQKLMLHPYKTLDKDELEIVLQTVNTK